jgi:GTP-binding protein EngB required for normal cell division
METLSGRALTSQLADDLGWLEQHSRHQPENERLTGQLRLAAALVRNCIGPFLDGQAPPPLHAVVVGGAGAGKSTVANLLSGSSAAEANPQAGFTRHPIAYTSSNGPVNWAAHLGFLGPLTRLTQASPASVDEDVYQVRRVPADPAAFDILKDFVVWDCPDWTTASAEKYIHRALEASALADVVVYVASDERYNDEIPTYYLKLLLQTGKPVIVCLTKMQPANAPAMLTHFQKEVLATMPGGLGRGAMCLAIPYLTKEQLADPAHKAPQQRIGLLNQAAVLAGKPALLRRNTVRGALRFLTQNQEHLLAVARRDLQALERWQGTVRIGQAEFDQRYFREYLTSEKFSGFDEALVRLLDLLELPGVGKVLSIPLKLARYPWQLLRGLMGKAMSRPDAPSRPELPILEDALAGWIDLLRKEAARHTHEHPLWAHIASGFQSGGLAERAHERFEQAFRAFQAGLADEVDRTARALYEELEKRPFALNFLRTSKFALDVAAIVGTGFTVGLNWHLLILAPVVTALTHQLVELLGQGVVDAQREQTRQRQQALLQQYVSAPLAEWLTQWPATGGSSFERLQQALRRIGPAIAQLEARVRQTAV